MAHPHNVKQLARMWQPLVEDRLALEVDCEPSTAPGDRFWYSDLEREKYNPDGNRYGPEDIVYSINSEGFRCDELVPSSEYDLRIVFVGCSFTYGLGLPLQEVYGYRIVSALRAEGLNVPYWNLAKCGSSVDYAARVLYQFMPRLEPDLVVALLPHQNRRELSAPTRYSDRPYIGNYKPGWNDADKVWDAADAQYDETNSATKTASAYALIHSLMMAHDCDLLWNNWGVHTDHQKQNLSAILPPAMAQQWFHLNHSTLFNGPKARDGSHWGAATHEYIAEMITPRLQRFVAMGADRRDARG